MKILLHSDDINLSDNWSHILNLNTLVVDDMDELLEFNDSIIVANISAFGNNLEDVVKKLVSQNNRLLLLDNKPELLTAKNLLAKGVKGYGNIIMNQSALFFAINTLKEGDIWLSPTLTSQLINELSIKSSESEQELTSLTSRQKEVALLLKEGMTYKEIGKKMDITPRTVKAHAEATYKKLGVKDRLALTLLLK